MKTYQLLHDIGDSYEKGDKFILGFRDCYHEQEGIKYWFETNSIMYSFVSELIRCGAVKELPIDKQDENKR